MAPLQPSGRRPADIPAAPNLKYRTMGWKGWADWLGSDRSDTRTRANAGSRPARLDGAPLDYAPTNELGVVFLFSHLAKKKYGLRVARVQAGYPDCLAFRGTTRIRIEFEYRSRNFAVHRHDPKKCDWIVCWIHDWPTVPKRLRVVELRQDFGLGLNVWFQPITGKWREIAARMKHSPQWSAPSQASVGDLVLIYRSRPDHFVSDLFKIDGPVRKVRAGWKKGTDWMAPIRKVCHLGAPIHFQELKDHPVLRHAGFVRGNITGRFRATDHWPELYRMIVGRNPCAEKALKKYGPERLA
jgi:hypothetical protein